MRFAGDAYGMRSAVRERKLLLMTALTAALAVHRYACFVEQASAEFNLISSDAVGFRYSWWREPRWQVPVELDRSV